MEKQAEEKKNKHHGGSSIRRQMYAVYFLVLLIPLTVVGVLLGFNVRNMLYQHYEDLLEADNLRVKTLMNELTMQAYNMSRDICFDAGLKKLLATDYENSTDFARTVNTDSDLDNYVYAYQGIEGIYIYTDNSTITNYKQFHYVTDDIAEQDWYQDALENKGAFWTAMEQEVSNVSRYNLCLVREFTMSDSDYHAVLVIRLSDDYIVSRIGTGIIDAICVDDSYIVSSSKKAWYGQQPFEIDYTDEYFSYLGTLEIEDKSYMASISSTHLHMTDSVLYICTLNENCYGEVNQIMRMWVLIMLLALIIPGIVLVVFTTRFTSRVMRLRGEMHRASEQDYSDITTVGGHDELAEAFEDLNVMVQTIKDKNARMYEAELNEKELHNEQQIMEYKMLASQINPHYLYNALETIRMKALISGDQEVAGAIRTLGKTLRYVLENTGASLTILKKELDHIENYLTIQKLRFGDRINYRLEVEDGIQLEEYQILPLLLQPIVENAVVHGLESEERGGTIVMRIRLSDAPKPEDEVPQDSVSDAPKPEDEELQDSTSDVQPQKLIIVISDNGCGMTDRELTEIRRKLDTPDLVLQSSIGLYNISQRIHLCYGMGYGMQIESKKGKGTRITLTLPVIA